MIKAAIFDLNGTVLNDEKQYANAFRAVLKKLGRGVDVKFPHTKGIGVKENWPMLLSVYKIKTDKSLEELEAMTQDEYQKEIPSVMLNKGFLELTDLLKENNIQIALGTSNTWPITDFVLEHLGITSVFDVITTKEDVSINKPSPQIFLATAEKLGLEPEDCLVFEDSQAGVEAAHAAGMKVIAVYHDKKHKKTLKDADRIVKDFSVISIKDLESS